MKKKLFLIGVTIAFLASPKLSFGQTPILFSAAGFVAFSTDRVVVNTSTLLFTENAGTNNSHITAFRNGYTLFVSVYTN